MMRSSKRVVSSCIQLLVLGVCLMSSLHAAEKTDPQTIPFRRFGLGWKTSLTEKISVLRIWYTLDNGHTWRLYSETTTPSSPAPVKVSEDGEYGFYTQTKDDSGLEEEPPVPGTPPKAIVVVDTKKPALVLVTPNSSDIFSNTQDLRIEWNATDINFTATPISLYFSNDGGGTWNAIKKNIGNTGNFVWKLPAQSAEYYKVKIVAVDRAGNESEDISDNNFTVDGRAPVSRVTGPKEAKTPNFEVSYSANDLGGAGIAKIGIYFQLNDAKDWNYYGEDKDLKSPFLFEAKQGGRYGFKLVATDRVGNSEAMPDAATRPDVVCLMDSVNPVVQLVNFKGKMDPIGATKTYVIQWKATDDNLSLTPVTIELSKDDGLTWGPAVIAANLKNTGEYPWIVPTLDNDIDNARLRVTALDVLGNKGVDVSDPFKIDRTPPVSNILSIEKWDEDRQGFEKASIENNIKLDPNQGVIKTPALTPNDHIVRASEAIKMGDLIAAEDEAKKALEADPNSFVAHAILGRVNYEKQELEASIESYQKSLTLNPNYQDSRIGLGLAHYTMGQNHSTKDKVKMQEHFAKAVIEYEAAAQILPDTYDEFFNLGYIYARLQKYSEAIQYLQKAIPLSDNNGDAYWYLGQVYEKTSKTKDAQDSYGNAAKAFPAGSEMQQKAENKVRQMQGN